MWSPWKYGLCLALIVLNTVLCDKQESKIPDTKTHAIGGGAGIGPQGQNEGGDEGDGVGGNKGG